MSIQAPAGRRRFWGVVLCFAVANAALWVGYDRYSSMRLRGTLRVVTFEPGNGASVGSRAIARWHFNEDAMSTAGYQRDPGSVSPAVAGQWQWEDPRTLTFTPQIALPRATRISFTLADSLLRSVHGGQLAQTPSNYFDCSPLELQEIRQSAREDGDRYVIELQFSDRVVPADVMAHLAARRADGKPVACNIYGQAQGKTIRVITDSIQSDILKEVALEFTVSPGLTGLGGPLALSHPIDKTLKLNPATAAVELTANAPRNGSVSLMLRLNNHVDLAAVREILSIDPPVPFTAESTSGATVILSGDFHCGTRYAVTLAAAPAGAGAQKYPRPGRLSVFVPDRESGVWLDSSQGYLSSAGNRTLMAHAMNTQGISMQITRVYDNNLVAWRNAAHRYNWAADTSAFAKPLIERTFSTKGEKNAQQDVRLTLDDLLPVDAPRDGVYRVAIRPAKQSPIEIDDGEDDEGDSSFCYASSSVVTMSDIALTAKQTRDGVVICATSLRSARPIEDVRVRVFSSKSQILGEATTDAQGLAKVVNIHPARDESMAVVLADRVPHETAEAFGPLPPATSQPAALARDLTWLDLRQSAWELGDRDVSGAEYIRTGHEAFVYSDRGVYRPGEKVHLRAIVRGGNSAAPPAAFPVKWQIRRPDLHDWKSQVVMLDADGAAAFDLELPADISTGLWTAELGLPGEKSSSETGSNETGSGAKSFGSVDFQVEEFIPNRMKVSLAFGKPTDDQKTHAAVESQPARYTVGSTPLKADVQGDYLFGRPAAGLALELSTRFDPISFQPNGWDGWTFGDSAKLASVTNSDNVIEKSRKQDQSNVSPVETQLESGGHYLWSIDAAAALNIAGDAKPALDRYPGPWRLTSSAGVHETGGRTVTATAQISIDAVPAYIGVRCADGAAREPGKPCELQIQLVKPDGTLASDGAALEAKLLRESWNTTLQYRDGRYHYNSTRVLDSVQSDTLATKAGSARWSPTPKSSGSYIVSLRDPRSGASTSMGFYITDGQPWDDNISRENPDRLEVRVLEPQSATTRNATPEDDKAAGQSAPKFHVGDTANILVASPFAGRLLVTVESDDVIQTTTMEITSSHVVVPVKITAACWPNAFVTATVIRPVDPNAKWQTHRAFGATRLCIDPGSRKLSITIDAPAVIEPLHSLDIGLLVKDSGGNPVKDAAVTLAAVDEGICQLTGFATPDPLNFFARSRGLAVKSFDVFDLLMPEVPQPDKTSAVGGDGAAKARAARRHISPVTARRVKPVSLAWLVVHTDDNGLAHASFPLPQFQGQLRIMAVAYDKSAFGSADADVTVRSPILAQTSWPRFAAPGDQFAVPIVLFNNTQVAGNAKVSIEQVSDAATPASMLQFGNEHRTDFEFPPIALSAGGQRQINLPVQISQAVGIGKVLLHASLNGESFDEELEIPIRPAAPLMQFGAYVAASTTQPSSIARPASMLAGTESFELRVTPFPALQLPQGLDYLDRYPYGCVEQTTSACFPLLALGEIGKQLDPVRFAPDRIKLKIDAGITQLIGMQTAQGGLSMWTGENQPWPWGSIYAAHFLTEAKAAGYAVPDDFYGELLAYARHLLNENSDLAPQLELRAYAAYVLALAGKPDRTVLNRLTELVTTTSHEKNLDEDAMRGDARLMLSCAWLLSGRRDLAESLISVSLPQPRSSRETANNLGSPTRDRAMLIYTLSQVQPANPALPELVQQLADAGANKQWSSTQDTAFAIMAIGRYLRNAPKPPAYDTAQILADETVLAETAAGKSLVWNRPENAASGTTRPADPSRYTVRITGAPYAVGYISWLQSGVPLTPPPEADHGIKIQRRYLDVNGNEIRNSQIRSGDLIHVELILQAPPRCRNLVIEDMLPAGLEAENQQLLTTAKSADDEPNDDTERSATFAGNRLEIRDDRVVIAGDMPATAVAKCEYWARAVTPGVFVLPPVRAEAMYDISTNAISGAGGKLTVLPATSNIASTGD